MKHNYRITINRALRVVTKLSIKNIAIDTDRRCTKLTVCTQMSHALIQLYTTRCTQLPATTTPLPGRPKFSGS